jgi:YVTN family beta-propeller protein
MTLEKTLIRRVFLLAAFALGTFAFITRQAAAQTPSPALLVVNRGTGNHSLAIVDPMTNKVVAKVPISGGGFPHEVAVSDDGKFAYVTNTGLGESGERQPFENPSGIQDDFIAVIDLTAQKEVRHIQTGPLSMPHDIKFAGGKLYFTCEGHRTVARYDPASDQIDWVFGTGQSRTHELDVTKDLNKIFTANGASGTVTAIEHLFAPRPIKHANGVPHDRWDATQIQVGEVGPEGLAISPDQKELWVLNRWNGSLSIIDVASYQIKQTLDLKRDNPIRVRFTPDGKLALIANNYDGRMLVLDALTRKVIKELRVPSTQTEAEYKELPNRSGDARNRLLYSKTLVHGILIAPDGSHAYATVMGSDHVAVIDMKTLEFTGQKISTGSRPESLGWAERR